MIYKTRTKYYRFERKLDEIVLIEMRGNKIVVNNRTFYVDKDFNVTEEITGMKIPYSKEVEYQIKSSNTPLEIIEEFLKSITDIIETAIWLRTQEGYTVKNFQGGKYEPK